MAGVTICVATFGDTHWRDIAAEHALASAATFAVPVVHVHGDTLWDARNACLDQVTTGHVVYLDADDELEPGYLQAMAEAPDADVRVPYVRYVTTPTRVPNPVMPRVVGHHHACTQACLPEGNWVVIGAQARTQLLRDVGGWRAYGWEDWDMWLRCHLAGARFTVATGAVYRAHVRPGSRGRYTPQESRSHHAAVANANGFDMHGRPLAGAARV